MFGIGTWELVVIFILALLILGPDKLPGVARTIGRSLTKLRQTADEVKREIDIDGIKDEFKSELLDDPAIAEIQQSLDIRGDIRRAVSELEDPLPLPGPAEETKSSVDEPGSSQPPEPTPDEEDQGRGPAG